MRVDDAPYEQTWDSKTITNLLHQNTSGSKSGTGNVLTSVVVDDGSNNEIDHGDGALTNQDTFGVIFYIPHFSDDVEETWCSGISEDDDVESVDGIDETWVGGSLDGNFERTSLRSGAGSIGNTTGDGQGDDGGNDRDDTNPSDPRDLVEGLDT